MDPRDEVVLTLTDETKANRNLSCPHKPAIIFHLLFRTAAILTYLFCGLFNTSFVVSFITVVFLSALDFWFVKNISGRQLVNLRWWNYVDENGKNKWVFESKPTTNTSTAIDPMTTTNLLSINANQSSSVESKVFWISLFAFQIMWTLMFFGSVFRFNLHWLVVVVIASVMNGTNLYGYLRCKVGGGNESIKAAGSNILRDNILSRLVKRGFRTK